MAKVRVLPKHAGIGVKVDTTMIGAIGSNFDLASVSEWTLEPRGVNEGI